MKRPIAYLAGVGKYAPPRVMKNAEFAALGNACRKVADHLSADVD